MNATTKTTYVSEARVSRRIGASVGAVLAGSLRSLSEPI